MTTNLVETVLRSGGPCLSTELAERLEAAGLSPAASRQRISRGCPRVRRLSGLVFPKKARFIFHEADFGSDRYWSALVRDVSRASPAYGPALAALMARGGAVPLAHFDIVSGSPLRQKGQLSSAAVLERLAAVGLLRVSHVDGVGDCVMLSGQGHFPEPDAKRVRARLATEKILILAVKDWARRLGMASFDSIAIRDDPKQPRYGTFAWDLSGPCYMSAMVRRAEDGSPKPGFLVCDAVMGDAVDEAAIAAFLRKCALSAGIRGLPPVMPLLIAERFTREAFRLGRSRGVLMATPYTLFGQEVAVGLATLLQVLTKAGAAAVRRPDLIPELFDKLGRIEGAAANLRGDLFEMLVGHAVHEIEGGTIDIGRTFYGGFNAAAQIDVLLAHERREVRAYECKAHHPGLLIDLGAVKEWLEEKVPVRLDVLRSAPRFADVDIVFELWTTGGFTAGAIAYMDEAKARLRRYRIDYKAGPEVRQYVAQLKSPGLLKMLDDHYFSHPLARLSRKYDADVALGDIKLDLGLGDLADPDGARVDPSPVRIAFDGLRALPAPRRSAGG